MLAPTNRHKFNIDEYLNLSAKGIFSENTKTELLNGEIIELSPLGYRHAKTQQLISRLLQITLHSETVFTTVKQYTPGSLTIGFKTTEANPLGPVHE